MPISYKKKGDHIEVKTTTKGDQRKADRMKSLHDLGYFKMCRLQNNEKPPNERMKQSKWNTKKKLEDILSCNLNNESYFITLTYRENMQDYDKSAEDFKVFIRHMKRTSKHEVKYVAIRELQKRGAIHFHVIFFNKVGRDYIKSLWKHGASNTKHIKDTSNPLKITNYFIGYLFEKGKKKNNPIVSSGKKIIFSSRNLIKPIKLKDNEIIKKARKAIDDEDIKPIKHFKSKYEGFVDIYQFKITDL
jgi:hypothetical protein